MKRQRDEAAAKAIFKQFIEQNGSPEKVVIEESSGKTENAQLIRNQKRDASERFDCQV